MTTETKMFRSMKQAQAFVAESALPPSSFGIVKLGTAKYELTISTPSATDDALAGAVVAATKKVKATRVNRHYNDDGSITIYIGGVKVRRFGGEENEEASEAELEDTEGFIETWLNRRHPKKTGGWVWGTTTQGHNWHTKKQKMLRARIAELEMVGNADRATQATLTDLRAQLAKIGGR